MNNEIISKAISKLTGIREDKIMNYTKTSSPINILERPNTINPTDKQMEKISILNNLIINYNIIKNFAEKGSIAFNSTTDISNYFKKLIGGYKDKERIYGAFLDKDNQIVSIKQLSEGTLNAAHIFPRDVIKEAVNTKCKSVVFCHNHPSGDPTPSQEDIAMTKRFENMLEPLEISLLDHVIVGDDDYSSLRNDNLLNSSSMRLQFSTGEELNKYNKSHEIFDKHLDELINCTSKFLGIKDQRIKDMIEETNSQDADDKPNLENFFSLLKDSNKIGSKRLLTESQLMKLNQLSEFIKQYEYVKEGLNTNSINFNSPSIVDSYYFDNIFQDNTNNSLIAIFLDTKLKVIATEEITDIIDNKITLNPKELLIKALAHEANGMVIINKNVEIKDINKMADDGIKISQRLINIFSPLQIKVFDYIITNKDRSFIRSLKEKGLFPYDTLGRADYKKIEICKEQELLYDGIEQSEEQEEWELEI